MLLLFLFLSLSGSQSVELTLSVVNQWPTLTMVEKLPYLLTEYDWNLYSYELQVIWNHTYTPPPPPPTTTTSSSSSEEVNINTPLSLSSSFLTSESTIFPNNFYTDVIPKDLFVSYHQEYQDMQKIQDFWILCDQDQNGSLHLLEYVLCRGEVDQHGNFYDRNEFDYLEEAIMKEFWDKVSKSDPQPEVYRYDEDGIIIDEE